MASFEGLGALATVTVAVLLLLHEIGYLLWGPLLLGQSYPDWHGQSPTARLRTGATNMYL